MRTKIRFDDPTPFATCVVCGHTSNQLDRSKLPEKVAWIDGAAELGRSRGAREGRSPFHQRQRNMIPDHLCIRQCVETYCELAAHKKESSMRAATTPPLYDSSFTSEVWDATGELAPHAAKIAITVMCVASVYRSALNSHLVSKTHDEMESGVRREIEG